MCDDKAVKGPVPETWLGRKCEFFYEEPETFSKTLLSKEDLIAKFDAGNYTVFAAMLLVSAAIGVYFWWKVKILNISDHSSIVN